MLTTEEIKTLLDMGFRYNKKSCFLIKYYDNGGYIIIYEDKTLDYYSDIDHDLAKLREKGII